MNFFERTYLFEILRGLSITIRHLIANLVRPSRMMTVSYPEQKLPTPDHYRAEHRLMLRLDETPRCTACQLCQTVCPSHCINIEPEECPTPGIEKWPKRFDIDMLRCVYCGFCVEACPCDAIRMDTGKYENASYTGPKLIYDKEYLLQNHPEGQSKYSEALSANDTPLP